MNSDNIYLESFNRSFEESVRGVKEGDYSSARNNLIRATRTVGAYFLKEDRLTQQEEQILDRLFHLIDKLTVLAKNQKENDKAGQNSVLRGNGNRSSVEDRILRGNQNGKDDDLTCFQAMDVPEITFDDIIGLEEVKQAVIDTIIKPRLYPDVYNILKIKPGGGILMYGHPGTGKTAIAKAIAHEVKAKFFSVKCSDLNGKYFGDVERNIKKLFETARAEPSAVIFLDEFESVATKRDATNSSVMKRAVSELLAQIDGAEGKGDSSILLLAATNIPWEIDSAFLRPGRFDKRIYIPLPDANAREELFKLNLKDVPYSQDLDFQLLAKKTEGFSPADIQEVVNQAKLRVANRMVGHKKNDGVQMYDLINVLNSYVSSVNLSDLKKLCEWKNQRKKN